LPHENHIIRPLDSADKTNKLKLRTTDGELGTFLRRSALRYQINNLAQSYVYVDVSTPYPQTVLGYISIVVSEIKNSDAATEEENFRFNYPAVKIARLAVDLRLQRTGGYGRDLISFCIALVKREIMPRVGCRFIVVDANRPALDFYQKCGFTFVDTESNRGAEHPVMFYDLQKVA
jgi:GNAT superfamily N-acetyltransferase